MNQTQAIELTIHIEHLINTDIIVSDIKSIDLIDNSIVLEFIKIEDEDDPDIIPFQGKYKITIEKIK